MAFTGRLGTDDSQLGNIVLGTEGTYPTGQDAFQSDAFQSDSFQQAPGNPAFTADAVLLKTTSVSFTADAVLVLHTDATFTADAWLIAVRTATFTANGIILTSPLRNFTANAVIAALHFTADAVIQKTQSSTKTANAVIRKNQAATFTADASLIEIGTHVIPANALITRDLVRDTFTRTTSPGDVGQPDVGHYGLIRDSFGNVGNISGSVNGSYLEPDTNFETIWYKFGPSSTALLIQFDYLIVTDGYYEVGGGTSPSTTLPPNTNLVDVWVQDQGDSTWYMQADGVFVDGLTPTLGDWWTAKAYIDHPGNVVRIKTWKRGDPEPDWLAQTTDPIDFFQWGLITIEHFVYAQSGEFTSAGLDNLIIQAVNTLDNQDWVTIDAIIFKTQVGSFTANAVIASTSNEFTFTADAVLRDFDGTYQWGFTVDAVLDIAHPTYAFTANAWIVKRTSTTFTANARMVRQGTGSFTANAWIKSLNEYVFTANAYIRGVAAPSAGESSTGLRKSTTIHVAERRPSALSAYIPPRNTEDEEQTTNDGPDLPCLPPCPGVNAYSGQVIRRTVIYCDACGVFYYTSDNKLGIGFGTTDGHIGCNTSHNRNQHEARIFADYSNMPTQTVAMVAKLLWGGAAPSNVGVKVFANISELPPLEQDDDFQNWTSTFENTYWSSGDYIGTLSFTATDSTTTASGRSLQWCDIASSLTLRPDGLYTDIFRFEITDLSRYYGAEFRAPNVPVTVE